jgi:DNA-directed RNA polymerase subunit RPC12/RpoP
MRLPCPRCKRELTIKHVSGPCPHCGGKVYFYDRWRWPRGIACGFLALLPMYLWYHFDGTLVLFIEWLAFVGVLWFVLFFFVSYRIVPPKLALAPQDGPIRLDV